MEIEEKEIIPERLLKLLLLIKLAEKIEGKTKLQKIVFLGKEEEDIDLGFEFVKYNYGPYSFELTKALETLDTLELIKTEEILFSSSDKNGLQTKQFVYAITPNGEKILNEKTDELKEVFEKIKKLVQKWNKISRTEIVRHVYSKYM